MNQDLPEIVKCAERQLAEVHVAVERFTRANRYGYGVELKRQALQLASITTRAWREAPRRRELVDELIHLLDDFKTYLRLGKQLQAFTSFRQFEALARTAESLGRQAGGWKKKQQQHPQGQNPTSQRHASSERATILSSRVTSTSSRPEVNR